MRQGLLSSSSPVAPHAATGSATEVKQQQRLQRQQAALVAG
jgi:hypothetical protein